MVAHPTLTLEFNIKFYNISTLKVLKSYNLGHIVNANTIERPIPFDYKRDENGEISV